jgi:hypothetical protein
MKTTEEIHDMIQNASVDPDEKSMSELLDILSALNQRMAAIENRADSTASYLANGIQPD